MNCKYLILLAIGAAVLLCVAVPGYATSVLGSADSFAVLGASTVTCTTTNVTHVYGDLGLSPGSSITGFASTNTYVGPGTYTLGPGLVSGTVHLTDITGSPNALQAQIDATKAYNGLAAMPVTTVLTGQNLGGLTLTSGVYFFATSAQLTGTLTLDAEYNNNAFWVFQIGSTLTTASNSVVQLINFGTNDGIDDGVFWQVGSSTTLGTDAAFEGNIISLASTGLNTRATILNGRAFARTGAVTMDNNVISNVCPNGGPGYNGGLYYDTNGTTILAIGPSKGPSGVIPEPLTLGGLFLGVGGLCGYLRRRASR
jgi:type VI secretion system secreted protein VgrG